MATAHSETSVTGSEASIDPVPAEDNPTHPILDIEVDHEAQARRRGVDWLVFGVTATAAVGFLIWGFLSTATLATVSGKALTWTMDNVGWLFVLTATGFRAIHPLAVREQVRHHPAGPRR